MCKICSGEHRILRTNNFALLFFSSFVVCLFIVVCFFVVCIYYLFLTSFYFFFPFHSSHEVTTTTPHFLPPQFNSDVCLMFVCAVANRITFPSPIAHRVMRQISLAFQSMSQIMKMAVTVGLPRASWRERDRSFSSRRSTQSSTPSEAYDQHTRWRAGGRIKVRSGRVHNTEQHSEGASERVFARVEAQTTYAHIHREMMKFSLSYQTPPSSSPPSSHQLV